ncbi:hypothetical protein FRB94_011277 [Tulasnella sp. JGI-2019a]|nr:hypothetical protein FRB93_004908 [Tulasnella sp. JGI-2019a]KAG8992806.1 hypothetical protein FRB94_011277 [Tulasnella sp. JGI-2019a]KAG9028430.1 hypothetical protein FRB95_006508 [Tulasnella sp. JGI-2019a]
MSAVPPSSPTQAAKISPDELAAVALKRVSKPLTDDELDEVRWAKEHDQRQHFRRLVDPGIIRHNNEATSEASIKCLATICQNILDHPEEAKYRRFKTTNNRIKAEIVEVKGGLEYATAIGFREGVENFSPYYAWKPTNQNVTALRIGAYVLDEFHQKIIAKEELAKVRKETKQDEAQRAAQKVKLAFEDDRKAMAIKSKMERERRQALSLAQQQTEAGEMAAALAVPQSSEDPEKEE